MSRILVLILIFVLFYQVSKMVLNIFRDPQENKRRTTARQNDSKVKGNSSAKGYTGGEYVDYEEVE